MIIASIQQNKIVQTSYVKDSVTSDIPETGLQEILSNIDSKTLEKVVELKEQLEEKQNEYNKLADAIENNNFDNVLKKEYAFHKHKTAKSIFNIALYTACGGGIAIPFGLCGGSVGLLEGGIIALIVGGITGFVVEKYINKKIETLSDDELINFYSNKVQKLINEINDLQNKIERIC
jgi:hypothetical protein